jgi:Aminoglycoside-2''-adenylyltransferase
VADAIASKHWDGPPLDAWQPWRPEQAAEQLAGVSVPWYVVGGWAIDLWLGHETRPHGDLEIAILRADFPTIRARLSGFVLHTVGDGEVRLLPAPAAPPADKHQNWVLDPVANAWRMDIMLEPGDAATWRFRRDATIHAPRPRMTGSRAGVPFLKPAATLLYKAKAMRPKDEADFQRLSAAPRCRRTRLACRRAVAGTSRPSVDRSSERSLASGPNELLAQLHMCAPPHTVSA